MHRKMIGAVALLMAGVLAPPAFAASRSSGLAGSAPENGTVAVEGGSMRNPGNVWVPSASHAPAAVYGSGQGGYPGNNPSADDVSASRAPLGAHGSEQGGYLGNNPGSEPTADK